MSRLVGGTLLYTVSEVAQIVGVHRATLIRWIDAEKVPDGRRDRNGWRVFTHEQVEQIKDFALTTTDPAEANRAQIPLFTNVRGTRSGVA